MIDLSGIPFVDRAKRLIEFILIDMEFVRAFPSVTEHPQSDEARERLKMFASEAPDEYVVARAQFIDKYAAEDRLYLYPGECPKCFGAGEHVYQGKVRKCGCPVAEARRRGVSLEQDAKERMAAVDMTPQLSLLPETPAEVVAMPSPPAAPAEPPRPVRGFSTPDANLIRIPDAPKRTYDKKVN